MHVFRQQPAAHMILAICLAFSPLLHAADDESSAIFYRQHMQGQSAIICDAANEDNENEPETCAAGYDIDEDETFAADDTKQEWGDFGMLTFSYHSPRGVGYSRGYYSLGFSNMLMADNNSFFSAADWRFHLMGNGRLALNLGAGGRLIESTLNHSLSAFAYYDFRTTHLKNYHQVGISTEWLSTGFDVRLNGYYPIGSPKSHTSHHMQKKSKTNPRIRNTYNHSYAHLDVEVGKLFDARDLIAFYFGTQGYYLKSREETHKRNEAYGAKLRLIATAKYRTSLELTASYDPIFKTRLQFSCLVPLSFDKSLIRAMSRDCAPVLLRKVASLPLRDDIIILKSSHYWSRP